MNNIQLYQHIRLDTEEIFYFGIGKGKRPWSKWGRNKHWKGVVAKHGYRVEVLEEGLSWYQACELEKMLIALYGRRDLGTGPLVNMTDGGDGALGSTANKGKTHSPEARAKMSVAKIGKTTSSETRAKMSASHTGKTYSPETRAKISNVRKAYWANKQKAQ